MKLEWPLIENLCTNLPRCLESWQTTSITLRIDGNTKRHNCAIKWDREIKHTSRDKKELKPFIIQVLCDYWGDKKNSISGYGLAVGAGPVNWTTGWKSFDTLLGVKK